ncbi:hypothetical protein TNCT_376791 [Trichonephila clavata]|uniref:Uncharacterized protein n=1 Tax=Trichonephila clavata TaxID=2740835 RepID=A0A8X6HI51_TRICU|nr:hypothetical protein TNCT_376791 [Trichonephila clavata]
MWRIMHDQCVHPYHLQSVQLLQPNDHPKLAEFAQWLMRNGLGDLGFPSSVIFTEEESFSREEMLNAPNSWAGIFGDCFMGP